MGKQIEPHEPEAELLGLEDVAKDIAVVEEALARWKPFSVFYPLLLGPVGQVQAEKEQVRGKIKRFLGGASPLQTSPAGGAKRPTLCRESTQKRKC